MGWWINSTYFLTENWSESEMKGWTWTGSWLTDWVAMSFISFDSRYINISTCQGEEIGTKEQSKEDTIEIKDK